MADITKTGQAVVQIACGTAGSTIHYTDDGSNPSSSSPIYSAGITTYKNKTFKAVAIKDDLLDSEIATLTVDIRLPTPELSSEESGTGNIIKVTNVADYANYGTVTFRYTTDDSEPTEESTVLDQTSGATIQGNDTVKVKAFATDNVASDSATLSVTVTLPTPVLAKAAGTASDNCTVSVSNTDAFTAYGTVTFRYTTDGNDPTEQSTVLSGSASITANCTVKVKAFATGYTASAVGSLVVSDLKVQTPVITVAE